MQERILQDHGLGRTRSTIRRWFAILTSGAIGWACAVAGLVALSWSLAFWTPVGSDVATIVIDQRDARSQPGRLVVLAGKRADPSQGDFIGHAWVRWPDAIEAEDILSTGATGPVAAHGYYARDQWQAARGLALNLLNPIAIYLGSPRVDGVLVSEPNIEPQIQLAVRVNAAVYARARAVHQEWLTETRYRLRPGARGAAIACQDYQRDVARALGLDLPGRQWVMFPFSDVLRLAKENWVDLDAVQPGVQTRAAVSSRLTQQQR